MADSPRSLKEWYEQQDMQSPGLAQIVKREKEKEKPVEKLFKVGDKVEVWHPSKGRQLVGTIIAKRSGPKFDIINDDGDELHDVEPFYMTYYVGNEEPSYAVKYKKSIEPRTRDEVKRLNDENRLLTIKYDTLREENRKSSERCEQTLNDLFKENRKLHNEKKEVEKQVRDCEAEVETLKQERDTHIRLIEELSTAQRATIKAGSRKNKHIKYVSKRSTASRHHATRRHSSRR
jgi:hypothetical protein